MNVQLGPCVVHEDALRPAVQVGRLEESAELLHLPVKFRIYAFYPALVPVFATRALVVVVVVGRPCARRRSGGRRRGFVFVLSMLFMLFMFMLFVYVVAANNIYFKRYRYR